MQLHKKIVLYLSLCISMVSSYTQPSNAKVVFSRRRLLGSLSILAPLRIGSPEAARAGELCLDPPPSSASTHAIDGCGSVPTTKGSVPSPATKKLSVPESAAVPQSSPPAAPIGGETDLQRAMMGAGGGKRADPRAHG